MKLPSILIILIALFLVVSTMDYRDEQQQQDLYCQMVGEGTWGDYNENYDELCDTRGAQEATAKKGPVSQ